MKIPAFILCTVLFLSSYSQNDFDIRKCKWGMTIAQVKESELPMTPIKEAPSRMQGETKMELTYDNVVINNINTTLIFGFENGKLIEILYRFNKTWQSGEMNLSSKVMSTQFVFKNLMNDKKMQSSTCWDYGLNMYSEYSSKNPCEYSTDILNDVEKVGVQNGFDQAFYSLKNTRTYARLQYRLIDNDPVYKEIIGWVRISAWGDALKSTKDSGF